MRPGRLLGTSRSNGGDDEENYWAGLEERPADFQKDSVTIRDDFRWRHFTNQAADLDPDPRSLWRRVWNSLAMRQR